MLTHKSFDTRMAHVDQTASPQCQPSSDSSIQAIFTISKTVRSATSSNRWQRKLMQAAHRFRPLWVSLSAVYIYVLGKKEKLLGKVFPRILT